MRRMRRQWREKGGEEIRDGGREVGEMNWNKKGKGREKCLRINPFLSLTQKKKPQKKFLSSVI